MLIPVYGLDLYPIEKVWKSIQQCINQSHSVKYLDELTNCVEEDFSRVKAKRSFASGW